MLIPNSPTAALNRQKFSQKPPQFEPSILTLRTAAVRRPLVAALEPPRFPHFDAQLAKTLLLIAHSTLGALVGRPALLSRGDSRPNKLRLFFSARRTRTCSCTFEPDERANTIKLISQWKFFSHQRRSSRKQASILLFRRSGTRALKITSATLFLSFNFLSAFVCRAALYTPDQACMRAFERFAQWMAGLLLAARCSIFRSACWQTFTLS